MDDDYFWSLVRKPRKEKVRKCLRCQVEFHTYDARLCGACNEINKKVSITATVKPMRVSRLDET
jgi:hypothetical protein